VNQSWRRRGRVNDVAGDHLVRPVKPGILIESP